MQVNVDDASVAPAMRFGPGRRIDAVLSTWEAATTPLLELLTTIDPDAAAWSVDEIVPLPPPEVPDGVRADALCNVAFLRRPETMTPEAWRAAWLEQHTAVAIETQNTHGYLQHPVREPLTEHGRDVAGVVEELFPMAAMTDHHAFYGSDGDEEEFRRRFTDLMASCARFGADQGLDLVPTSRYVVDLSAAATS